MSSPPPPGSPPPPPPAGSPPPGPPPPPPPSASAGSQISSANYFFGFVITFVVLLLIFVGCGIGSWHRFRLIGTAWDERIQAMDGSSPILVGGGGGSPGGGRKRGRRRRPVRPIFWEPWTSRIAGDAEGSSARVALDKWQSVQPISAAFVSRTKRKPEPPPLPSLATTVTPAATTTPQTPLRSPSDNSVRSMGAVLRAYVLPRRPRFESPPKPPPPPVERPAPEAIQVAVLIAMPRSLSLHPTATIATSSSSTPGYVGHASGGEYEIGVVQMPWLAWSGDG